MGDNLAGIEEDVPFDWAGAERLAAELRSAASTLTSQISKLDSQGKVLSNPDVWDGPLAQQFRDSTWPETKSALDKAHTELDQLREQLQKIATNIMTAGGGA